MSATDVQDGGAGLVPAPPVADSAAVGDFAGIYDRYLPGLTRYCARITGNAHDAEDAAQNAMLRALAALERGTQPRAVRPWLFRIGHNEAVTLLRARRAVPGLPASLAAPAAADPGDLAEARERLSALLSDLRELSPRQRAALVGREINGCSYEDLADDLGVSVESARQTVCEARASLARFRAGRALGCESVRRTLRARDRSALRSRSLRAHLRSCDGCRGFQATLTPRRRDLLVLMPLTRLLTGWGGTGRGAPVLAAWGRSAGELAVAGLAVAAATIGTPPARTPAPPPQPTVLASAPAALPRAAAVALPASHRDPARIPPAGATRRTAARRVVRHRGGALTVATGHHRAGVGARLGAGTGESHREQTSSTAPAAVAGAIHATAPAASPHHTQATPSAPAQPGPARAPTRAAAAPVPLAAEAVHEGATPVVATVGQVAADAQEAVHATVDAVTTTAASSTEHVVSGATAVVGAVLHTTTLPTG